MLTMNQAGTLINTTQLIIILCFVFCMVQMIMNHIFRMKAHASNCTESEHYQALRRQLTFGLGLLLIGLLVALTFIGFLQNWNHNPSGIRIDSDPRLMRAVTNEIINAVRLLVIFVFVSVGTKIVIKYREQVAKLRGRAN